MHFVQSTTLKFFKLTIIPNNSLHLELNREKIYTPYRTFLGLITLERKQILIFVIRFKFTFLSLLLLKTQVIDNYHEICLPVQEHILVIICIQVSSTQQKQTL